MKGVAKVIAGLLGIVLACGAAGCAQPASSE